MADIPRKIKGALEAGAALLPINEVAEYQEALAQAAGAQENVATGLDDLDRKIRTLSSSLTTLSRTGIAQTTLMLKENITYIRYSNTELLNYITTLESRFPGASNRAIASINTLLTRHGELTKGIVRGNKEILETAAGIAILEGNIAAASYLNQLRSGPVNKTAIEALAKGKAGVQNLELGVGESLAGQGLQKVIGAGGELSTWLSHNYHLADILAVLVTYSVGKSALGNLFGGGGGGGGVGGAIGTSVATGVASRGLTRLAAGTALTGYGALFAATGFLGYNAGKSIRQGLGMEDAGELEQQRGAMLDNEFAKLARRRARNQQQRTNAATGPGTVYGSFAAVANYRNDEQFQLDEQQLIVLEQRRQIAEKLRLPAQMSLKYLQEELEIDRKRLYAYQEMLRTATEKGDKAAQLAAEQVINEQKMKMLDRVQFVRRSLLEGIVGDLMSFSGGSSTMPQGLARAQIEASGYTQGSMQTSSGFKTYNPDTGKYEDQGPNTMSYSKWVSKSLGLAMGDQRDPAQRLVQEAIKTNKNNEEVKRVLEKILGALENGISLDNSH